MATLPPEIAQYFKSGKRKIVSVAANDNYTLTLIFDNGEIRLYDMAEALSGAVFQPLRSLTDLRRVYLDDCGCVSWDIDPNVDSNVVWSNKVDLCPDSCYLYSVPMGGASDAR